MDALKTLEMDLIPAKDIPEFKARRQYYCSLPYRGRRQSRIQLFKGDVLQRKGTGHRPSL